ncbi:MAG TPA: hypothetical protein VFB97_05550 [Bacteroidales bacterium]|nr:hypothetical protein [Bacteroidales bacterium]
MKSTIVILFCFLILSFNSFGQENFKVIKVNGTIVLKTKGVSLETGTVFNEKEDLLFRTDDANAAVINPQKGRLIITSKNHNLASASSNYLPAMYNISTRGAFENPEKLQDIFSGKYVILDKQQLVIDKSDYPMDKDHFFFLRYVYKGEEINKKLDYSGDTLIIDKKGLYTVDGQPIPSPDNTSIRLFYRNGNESINLSEFDLIFPDTRQLGAEVKVILESMPNRSPSQKIAEVKSYISDQYGKINQEDLLSWLEKSFNLKIK